MTKTKRKPGGGRKLAKDNLDGEAMTASVPIVIDRASIKDAEEVRKLRNNKQSRSSVFREAIHRGLPLILAEARKSGA